METSATKHKHARPTRLGVYRVNYNGKVGFASLQPDGKFSVRQLEKIETTENGLTTIRFKRVAYKDIVEDGISLIFWDHFWSAYQN